jgi:hypothetical protein
MKDAMASFSRACGRLRWDRAPTEQLLRLCGSARRSARRGAVRKPRGGTFALLRYELALALLRPGLAPRCAPARWPRATMSKREFVAYVRRHFALWRGDALVLPVPAELVSARSAPHIFVQGPVRNVIRSAAQLRLRRVDVFAPACVRGAPRRAPHCRTACGAGERRDGG